MEQIVVVIGHMHQNIEIVFMMMYVVHLQVLKMDVNMQVLHMKYGDQDHVIQIMIFMLIQKNMILIYFLIVVIKHQHGQIQHVMMMMKLNLQQMFVLILHH